MDYGIGSMDNYHYVDHLNPFEQSSTDQSLDNDYGLSSYSRQESMTTQGNSCQMGAEIILKRIIKKLLNQMNELQPSELDDEFIYESTLTYSDYLNLLKETQSGQSSMNCANLNRVESILSNLMSGASMKRPTQTSLLSKLMSTGTTSGSLPMFTSSGFIGGTTTTHLFTILFVVCLISWFLSQYIRCKTPRAITTSLLIVGFVEFCLHSMTKIDMSQRLNLERCANPSYIARFASLFNYDYDNCRHAAQSARAPNIAITALDFLTQLVTHPLIPIGENIGKSVDAYFKAFTGLSYYLFALPVLALLVISPAVIRAYLAPRVSNESNASKNKGSPRKLKIQGVNNRPHAITNRA